MQGGFWQVVCLFDGILSVGNTICFPIQTMLEKQITHWRGQRTITLYNLFIIVGFLSFGTLLSKMASLAGISWKKMSDRVLSECRKHFWKKYQNSNGMLSWGDVSKLLRATEMRLNNQCMNQLYQICDEQKHGCIQFNEFLSTYFRYERKLKPQCLGQPVRDLSVQAMTELRKEFFDISRKRYGRLTRTEFVEMIHIIGVILTNEELYQDLDISDRSKDGKISFESFICFFFIGIKRGNRAMAELEIISRCYKLGDLNNDGKLSRTEF